VNRGRVVLATGETILSREERQLLPFRFEALEVLAKGLPRAIESLQDSQKLLDTCSQFMSVRRQKLKQLVSTILVSRQISQEPGDTPDRAQL